MAFLQIIVVVTCVLAITNAAPLENVMPSEIVNCINRLTPVLNTTDSKKVPGLGTPEDVHLYCLQQFVWRADMVHWDDFNITKKDKDFVNGLLVSDREAMRRIDNTVSLPYWDSTFDFNMANPANTILFSPEFFGNGFGAVTTGPFANWTTPIGRLTRNIGGDSTLMTQAQIQAVLRRCRTRDITRPTAITDFEGFHGGPHVWVGGQMSGLGTSSWDPIFFLHHAFVDYIWERFRIRQASSACNRINPENYPSVSGPHAANNTMVGLPGYRNIDGYRNYWTRNWYRYEDTPRCPNCNSSYLYCNTATGFCVSRERNLTAREGSLLQGKIAFDPAATTTSEDADDARAQVEKLDIGRKFDAPPAEPRTQKAQMARMEEAARTAGASR